MEPVNIGHYGLNAKTNHRLWGEPLPLLTTVESVGAIGTDRWEDDGGAPAPPIEVVVDLHKYISQRRRLAKARGQRAGRLIRRDIKVITVEKIKREAEIVLEELEESRK